MPDNDMYTCLAALFVLASNPIAQDLEGAQQHSTAVRIAVTRWPEDDRWTASYTLAEPVTELRFPDNTTLFRHTTWSVETEGLELVVHDGFETIRESTGAPFTQVEFSFANHIEHLDRSYEFHVPFTDGGVLLYTGHFEVHSEDGALATELVLSGRAGEHIWIDGTVHDTCTLQRGSEGFGTYAYFGAATPVETADVVALVDPGLPEWIRSESERYLPLLFALYTEQLALELNSKPMVLFSYIEGAEGMNNYSGGALGGLIQLTVMGQKWSGRDEQSSESFQRLIGFLAHESVHLWNRPVGEEEPEPGSAWMHEGGADALSFRALRELGVIDRAGLFERHERALNSAAQRLAGTSVRDSGTPQLSMNFYEAGSALALATELAIQSADPDLDLFDFWRELLRASRASSEIYTQADYYALADRMAPGTEIGARLRTFVETRHEDPAAAFMDLLAPFEAVRMTLDFDSGRLTLEPAGDGR